MGNEIEPPIEISGNPTSMDYENFPFDLLKLPGIKKVAEYVEFCPHCNKSSLFMRGGLCIRCEIKMETSDMPQLQLVTLSDESVELAMVGT